MCNVAEGLSLFSEFYGSYNEMDFLTKLYILSACFQSFAPTLEKETFLKIKLLDGAKPQNLFYHHEM